MLKHDVTINPSLESLISILVACNKQIKMALLNSFLIELNFFFFWYELNLILFFKK